MRLGPLELVIILIGIVIAITAIAVASGASSKRREPQKTAKDQLLNVKGFCNEF